MWDGILPISNPLASSPIVYKGRDAEGRAVADGASPLPEECFVAMNRFAVRADASAAFERRWAERESSLQVPIPHHHGHPCLPCERVHQGVCGFRFGCCGGGGGNKCRGRGDGANGGSAGQGTAGFVGFMILRRDQTVPARSAPRPTRAAAFSPHQQHPRCIRPPPRTASFPLTC